MAELQTAWQAFVSVITNPFNLLQSTVEYVQTWLFTRRWFTLVVFSPALITLGSAITLVSLGAWRDQAKLLKEYAVRIDAETAKNVKPEGEAANKLIEEENISDYAEMLLRRVLQMEKSNVRATYLVASQFAKQGQVGQSRQMMRKVAPSDSRGFPPAHAWLAADRLSRRGVSNPEEKKELLHDLEIAATWDGSGPALMAVFARLLESEGRIGDAIAVLTSAAERDPSLNFDLASLAHRSDRKQPRQVASESVMKLIQEKIANNKATANDYGQLANLLLMEKRTDEAIKLTEQGLAIEPDNSALKRLASEALRIKYRSTIKNSPTSTEVDLRFLDAALKMDPTNSAVTEEIALLLNAGKQATPEIEEMLNYQLASGKASALNHLLLANRRLASGALTEAIPHLELALLQAPKSSQILNNLALALARTQPDNLERPFDLINQALKISGNHPEFLDTLGEILMIKGDTLAAISEFEKALDIDGNRISTRQLLLSACEKAGLKDMAMAQKTAIQELQSKAKSNP